jgi:hypothetical protein
VDKIWGLGILQVSGRYLVEIMGLGFQKIMKPTFECKNSSFHEEESRKSVPTL